MDILLEVLILEKEKLEPAYWVCLIWDSITPPGLPMLIEELSWGFTFITTGTRPFGNWGDVVIEKLAGRCVCNPGKAGGAKFIRSIVRA